MRKIGHLKNHQTLMQIDLSEGERKGWMEAYQTSRPSKEGLAKSRGFLEAKLVHRGTLFLPR